MGMASVMHPFLKRGGRLGREAYGRQESEAKYARTKEATHADGRNKNGRALRRGYLCRDSRGGRGVSGAVNGSMGEGARASRLWLGSAYLCIAFTRRYKFRFSNISVGIFLKKF
jgi:hypothetical protein